MFLFYTFSVFFFYIILLVLHQKRMNIWHYVSNLDVISGRRHMIGSILLKDIW